MILAIDPGISGALAWLEGEYLVAVEDMPTIEVRGKRRVNAAALSILMAKRDIDLVVIEGVSAMPRQGVSSTFAFGYAAGLIEGVVVGLGLPVEIVQASIWKRRAGVPADKGAVRQMASRYWPGAAASFARVKDDGRADAALLGRWYAQRP